MLDKITHTTNNPPANEHDVELAKIKLQQLQVEKEIIDSLMKATIELNRPRLKSLVPNDGRFTISVLGHSVTLERYLYNE